MEKVFITDKQGNKVLPKTHVSAVYDDEGNDLGSHLGAFEDEVRGLVDTPHQEYVTVATYSALPASGSEDTIYRVSNYDGSQSQVAADVYSEYAWDGTQYVFLCVKSAVGEVFDISAYHNNAKYADLNAALTSNTGGVPQSLQKGGMSVKYVQSSDNKYVQFQCISNEFTINPDDWAICNNDLLVESYEWIHAIVDKEHKILEAYDTDGKKHFFVEVNFNEANANIFSLDDIKAKTQKDDGFLKAIVDKDGKVIEAITADGNKILYTNLQILGNIKNKGLNDMDIRNKPDKLVFQNDSGRELISIHAGGVVKIDGLCIPSPDGKIYNVIINHKDGKPYLDLVELSRYEKIYNEQN